MKATVYIEIENSQLQKMGVEQDGKYAPFIFNPDKFVGYWISEEENEITFYLDSMSFICELNSKNIKLFNDILNEKSCSCHNNVQQV